MTLRQAALDLYKPPFRYEYGYVFDSNNQMVADKGEVGKLKGLIATRIRGWGRIQYMDNPVGRAGQLQDEVGKIVAEALNEYWGTSLAEELVKLKADLSDFMPEPVKMVQVPLAFVQAFQTLVHNYSLEVVPPDFYYGVEKDAYRSAFRRCGQELAEAAKLLGTIK